MKENTADKIAKFALIVIGVPFLIGCLLVAVWILDSLFGNPFSKNLAEKTALEYIEENYPEEDCYIEHLTYDVKYEDYHAHIVSTSDENIDFSLYITKDGEITITEYW